jgi:hypothetical protein
MLNPDDLARMVLFNCDEGFFNYRLLRVESGSE